VFLLIREDNAEGGFRAIPVRGKCEFWFDWRLVSAVRLAYGRCCACFTCGFRPCGASHFLLLRQKKVSKEKATPGYAVGCADSPALLAAGGGCGTRGYAPQTVLALYPPSAPLLGAPHGDPERRHGTTALPKKKEKPHFLAVDR